MRRFLRLLFILGLAAAVWQASQPAPWDTQPRDHCAVQHGQRVAVTGGMVCRLPDGTEVAP